MPRESCCSSITLQNITHGVRTTGSITVCVLRVHARCFCSFQVILWKPHSVCVSSPLRDGFARNPRSWKAVWCYERSRFIYRSDAARQRDFGRARARVVAPWVLYMRGDSNGGWGRAVSVSRTDAHSPDPDTKGAPSRTWGTPGLRLGI